MAARIRSLRNGLNPIDEASRDDLVLADVVTVTALDAATTYSWTIAFAPEGSTATFSGSPSAVSPGTFTVDIEGPYLIRLTIDAGETTEDTQYVRLRALTSTLGLTLVSAGERRDGTGIIPVDVDTEGWANEQNNNLLALEAAAAAIPTLASVLGSGNTTSGNHVVFTGGDEMQGAAGLILRAGGASDDIELFPGASGAVVINGKLTVTGLIDPTGMIFEQAVVPSTTATEGAVFVSDGSSGLTAGNIYFRPASDGTPQDLLAGGVVAPLTFVYQPGGSAGGNVYTDFATLYAALSAASGFRRLVFDATFAGGPMLLPVGTYDFTDVKWSTGTNLQFPGGPGTATVQFQDGTTITNLNQVEGIILYYNAPGGTPPIVYNSGALDVLYTRRSWFLAESGSAPIMSVQDAVGPTPTTLVPFAADGGAFGGNNQEWLEILGSSQVNPQLRDNTTWQDDGIVGGVTTSVSLQYDATCNVNTAQPNMAGTLSFSRSSWADRLRYDNSTSGLSATEVQAAIDELASVSQTVAPRTFVYRPGGTPAGNVYTNFATLYLDYQSAPAGQKRIVLDASQSGGVMTLPVGTYDLPNTLLTSASLDVFNQGAPLVRLLDGTIIKNLSEISGLDIWWDAFGTAPLQYGEGGKMYLHLHRSRIRTDTGGSPIMGVFDAPGPTPTELSVRMTGGSHIGRDLQETIVVSGSASSMGLGVWDDSVVNSNTLQNGVGTSITIQYDVTGFYFPTQPSVLGALSVGPKDQAANLNYSGAGSALSWGGPGIPGNVEDALDRIANFIASFHGPIP